MADRIFRNTEAGFVTASVLEFFHLWRSKKNASLTIECKDGAARVNFNCYLGHPDQQHTSKPRPKKRKSANRISRGNARAAKYQAEGGPPPTVSPPPPPPPVTSPAPQDGPSSRSGQSTATTPKRTATSPIAPSPKRSVTSPLPSNDPAYVQLPVWDPCQVSPEVLREESTDQNLSLVTDLQPPTNHQQDDDHREDVIDSDSDKEADEPSFVDDVGWCWEESATHNGLHYTNIKT